MWKYGQYCPVAHALEILGDRWTLLIVRDLMQDTRHFNDLERGLPGISRGLLSRRLTHLQKAGIVEKRHNPGDRRSTEYHLTEAGHDLEGILHALVDWGTKWAFDDPTPDELNSVLLMWWMHKRVNIEQLPQERVVVQFDFYGAEKATYWLVLKTEDVTLCLTDPGFDLDLLVTADLAAFFKLWLGRISYEEALRDDEVRVDGAPRLMRAFPGWFAWSAAAPEVRAARAAQLAL
jgi:DNA-binding HxlR family transcriptional regulator